MRLVVIPMLGCIWASALVGCGKSPDLAQREQVAVPTVEPDRIVEAACARCMYDMQDVMECAAAVKIDGKPYIIAGAKLDDQENELCSSAKKADVAGDLKDGKFVASVIKLHLLK